MGLKTLVVMPARYGSQRLPGKPVRDLCGFPAILYSLQSVCCPCDECRKERTYDFILATDTETVAEKVLEYRPDVEVAITSHELETGTDRMAAVMEMKPGYDLYVNVQGDMPFINPHVWIEPLIAAMEANPDVDMATPISVYKFVSTGYMRTCEWMHVGVYAYRPDALRRFYEARTAKRLRKEELRQNLEQCRAKAIGLNIAHMNVECPPPLELNDEADLANLYWHVCTIDNVISDHDGLRSDPDEQPDEQPASRLVH